MKNYIRFSRFISILFILGIISVFIINNVTTTSISTYAYFILITLWFLNDLIRLRYTRFVLKELIICIILGEPIYNSLYLSSLDICGIEYKVKDMNEVKELIKDFDNEHETDDIKEDNTDDT